MKDGGPAFAGSSGSDGMSLRDWYAGMAMQSYIITDVTAGDAIRATWSYRQADAMIAAMEAV